MLVAFKRLTYKAFIVASESTVVAAGEILNKATILRRTDEGQIER